MHKYNYDHSIIIQNDNTSDQKIQVTKRIQVTKIIQVTTRIQETKRIQELGQHCQHDRIGQLEPICLIIVCTLHYLYYLLLF